MNLCCYGRLVDVSGTAWARKYGSAGAGSYAKEERIVDGKMILSEMID